MLYFKKNIYGPPPWDDLDLDEDEPPEPWLDPYSFMFTALTSDRQVFTGLQHIEESEIPERLNTLFPHASRFGDLKTLNNISKRLLEGLVNRENWYQLSSYHFCFLYDTLLGTVEEYSYSDMDNRMELFPEWGGNLIDFNQFLNDYFFNTVFLMDSSRFNDLSPEEKDELKSGDSTLFGVINGLLPTPEETELKCLDYSPYS